MIQYLSIKDLALIDQVTLEFDKGLTVITGETGAGKSILLGALAILSGARVDRTVIRHAQDQCEVEAAILIEEDALLNEKLASLNLPLCEDRCLLISRSLHRSKVPRIQVNGAMTTLANLAEIGEYWIDFHGPGEPQKLFKEKFQLEILDLFGRCDADREAYRTSYLEWRRVLRELESVKEEKQLSPDEMHFLQTQIARIDEVDPSDESIEKLESDFRRISGSEEMIRGFSRIQEILNGEGGVAVQLAQAIQQMGLVAGIDSSAQTLADRLESLAIEVGDVSGEIDACIGDADWDEAAIEAVRARMELWMDLKRRHGRNPELVREAREAMALRLSTHSDIGKTIRSLETDLSTLEAAMRAKGEVLQKRRAEAAQRLSELVGDKLKPLGFAKAQFKVEVDPSGEPTEHGTGGCCMLFAPNPGQPMLPLAKIASSGETARVMLALKAVLAAYDATPVLVFDEVDANVGGEIGGSVGAELARVSDGHQVFCVTHLPQVACQGNHHFVVTKSQSDDHTDVNIRPLGDDPESRIGELARMLGDRNSASAISHARELLARQK